MQRNYWNSHLSSGNVNFIIVKSVCWSYGMCCTLVLLKNLMEFCETHASIPLTWMKTEERIYYAPLLSCVSVFVLIIWLLYYVPRFKHVFMVRLLLDGVFFQYYTLETKWKILAKYAFNDANLFQKGLAEFNIVLLRNVFAFSRIDVLDVFFMKPKLNPLCRLATYFLCKWENANFAGILLQINPLPG